MKIKVYTHPSSERAVKIAVRDRFKKLDEKPPKLRDMNLEEDGYDEIKDDMYNLIKNDEIESPFADDRSI